MRASLRLSATALFIVAGAGALGCASPTGEPSGGGGTGNSAGTTGSAGTGGTSSTGTGGTTPAMCGPQTAPAPGGRRELPVPAAPAVAQLRVPDELQRRGRDDRVEHLQDEDDRQQRRRPARAAPRERQRHGLRGHRVRDADGGVPASTRRRSTACGRTRRRAANGKGLMNWHYDASGSVGRQRRRDRRRRGHGLRAGDGGQAVGRLLGRRERADRGDPRQARSTARTTCVPTTAAARRTRTRRISRPPTTGLREVRQSDPLEPGASTPIVHDAEQVRERDDGLVPDWCNRRGAGAARKLAGHA